MRSDAWVWHGGADLRLQPVDLPEPGPGQVVLALRAAGICSTDLHVLKGGIAFAQPPHTMGHEGAGVVASVGPGVPATWLGKRCAVDTVIGCGHCRYCLGGRKDLCAQMQEIGQTIPGMWARHCLVPVDNLVPLADGVSFGAATQMETLNCVLGGVDKLRLLAGETAIVLGCGVTSILFVRMLQLQGMGRIVFTGTRENRLRLARDYGADLAINVRQVDLQTALGDERFDIVVETVGSRESIAQAQTLAVAGGRVMLFGIPSGNCAEIDVMDAIWRDIPFIPTCSAPQAWPRVAMLVNSGRVHLEPLISHRFPFARLNEAVACARERRDECVKAVVEME